MATEASTILEYWHQAIRFLAMEGRVDDADYIARGLAVGTATLAGMSTRARPRAAWRKCVLHVSAVLRRADETDAQVTTVLAVPAEVDVSGKDPVFRPPSDAILPAIPRAVLLAEGEDRETLVIGTVDTADEWVSMHGAAAEEARRAGDWGAWWLASMSLLTETAGLLSPHEALEMLEKDLSATQSTMAGTKYVMRVDVVQRREVPPELRAVAGIIDKARSLPLDAMPAGFRTMLDGQVAKTRFRIEGMIRASARHFGVMEEFKDGGEHNAQVLDETQRLALLSHISGESVTAVTGPPGTGKTTALSSIIANALVSPLLEDKSDRPSPSMVLATAPTNQAVKNIISAFGAAADPTPPGEMPSIAGRWLDFVNSYGFYFAASTERGKLRTLYNNKPGDTDSDAYMVFSRYCRDVEAKDGIKFDTQFYGAAYRLAEFYSARGITKNIVMAARRYVQIARTHLKASFPEIASYSDVKPAMDAVAKRLRGVVRQNVKLQFAVHQTLWEALRPGSTQEDIDRFGVALAAAIKAGARGGPRAETADDEATRLMFQISTLPTHESPSWVGEVGKIFQDVQAHLDDGLRAWAFHLSARYWEARWVISRVERIDAGPKYAKSLSDVARDHGLAAAVREDMSDLLFLAPCVVATAHSMSGLFGVKGREIDLAGTADTIIVDEAGQGQPEIVTPPMIFARRAIVLGDAHQLQPVHKITPQQDVNIARLVMKGLDKPFEVPPHLSVSSGTVMRAALEVAPEIILTRHYRCRPEIINWSNRQCYGGRLIPMRQSIAATGDDDPLPVLGYASVYGSSDRSDKRGSVRNSTEAAKLADWLYINREAILQRWGGPLHDAVGILTPYAKQKQEIRRALMRRFEDDPDFMIGAMKIGSVHQLQGAQRKLILFSVATEAPGPGQKSFLDQSLNLLNTARTRAQDSFILFASPSMIARNDDLPFGTFMADLKANGRSVRVERPTPAERPMVDMPAPA